MSDYESFLKKEEEISNTLIPTANFATRSNTSTEKPKQVFQQSRNYNGQQRKPSSKIICQFCEKPGHSAKQCFKIKPRKSGPSANYASTTKQDGNWLLDSGASHHVSSDLSKLKVQSDYDRTDSLIIGDGSLLPITHTGSSTILTSTKNFHLENVLHVLSANRNIISVSKFCENNSSSIEFFPFGCVVKDLSSRKLLARGQIIDGVYQLKVDNHILQPQALAMVRIKIEL